MGSYSSPDNPFKSFVEAGGILTAAARDMILLQSRLADSCLAGYIFDTTTGDVRHTKELELRDQNPKPILTPKEMADAIINNVENDLLNTKPPKAVTAYFSLIEEVDKKIPQPNVHKDAHLMLVDWVLKLPGIDIKNPANLDIYDHRNYKKPAQHFHFDYGNVTQAVMRYSVPDIIRQRMEEAHKIVLPADGVPYQVTYNFDPK